MGQSQSTVDDNRRCRFFFCVPCRWRLCSGRAFDSHLQHRHRLSSSTSRLSADALVLMADESTIAVGETIESIDGDDDDTRSNNDAASTSALFEKLFGTTIGSSSIGSRASPIATFSPSNSSTTSLSFNGVDLLNQLFASSSQQQPPPSSSSVASGAVASVDSFGHLADDSIALAHNSPHDLATSYSRPTRVASVVHNRRIVDVSFFKRSRCHLDYSQMKRESAKTLKCPRCNWHYKYQVRDLDLITLFVVVVCFFHLQETLEIHMKEKHAEPEIAACNFCLHGQMHPKLARGESYSCGYKPYKCEVCKYSTTTKGNLSIHMQSDKHLHAVQEQPVALRKSTHLQ